MSKDSDGGKLEDRAWRAMLAYSFFRWESAVNLALALIMAVILPNPFPWWRWWYWLILGGVAEVLIVVTSLTDQATGARVVAAVLREQFNPRHLRSEKYRERVEKALEYQRRIEDAVRNQPAGVLRDRLRYMTDGINEWIAAIHRLASGLDAYEADEVIKQDMRSVPLAIKNYRERLKQEDDEAVKEQVQEAIRSKKEQWANLQKLQNTMEKAEFQLEQTLSALGTVYSQMLLIGARGAQGDKAQRLREDITEQVESLQDLIQAMDEVYAAGATSRRRVT
jgi:DNA repair exonuclease SbcCD ATPase subunit